MSVTAASEPVQILWDKAAFYLRHAISLFGDPAALAQRAWLSRLEHRRFADYIRPLEEIVRRIIFIMALGLSPMILPAAPERKYRMRLALPGNTGAAFDPEKPETWRVAFTLAPGRRRLAGIDASAPSPDGEAASAPARARYPAHRVSSAPCAERLEALLRAYENREKLAAALARKLARSPRAAYAYTKPPRPRAYQPIYSTLYELAPLAAEAHQRFILRELDALLPDTS